MLYIINYVLVILVFFVGLRLLFFLKLLKHFVVWHEDVLNNSNTPIH